MGLTAAVVALVAFSQAGAAPSLDVVRDGQPCATVVVAADASQQVKDAAGMLVSCIEEATGAKLPVASAVPEAGTVLAIGRCPGIAAPDQTGLDGDGFDIAFPDGRTVLILGPTDWGTEFGVCEFLEHYAGVRWLLPGPDGTDIPQATSISVPREPLRQQPAFFSRLFSGLRGSLQAEWARRNRMHGRVSFHHHILELFPPETYTKSHPEFFPIHDGKRVLPPTNDSYGWQPCYSAPGIVEEAIKNIVEFFDKHPNETSYSLGANDSSGYCRCEQCLAKLPAEKNFLGLADYSDQYYDWCNKVIAGVLKTHPDKVFGCLAYSEVAAPPKTVMVHPRLIPYMTYDRMKWVDPQVRKDGEAATRGWAAQSPTLGWYDYIYGSPYCVPRVWFHHMAEYYRFGHANHVRALYAEAYPNWGEGPKLYVSLKLQWDPTRDVDSLLREWYVRCVGEAAAPELAAYYALWEDFWTRRVLQSKWFTRGGQYLRFSDPGYLADVTEEDIATSRRLLESALAKAGTPKQRARAKLLLDAFEYYEATALSYKARVVANEPLADEDAAIAAIDRTLRTLDLARRRVQLVTEVFPRDPVLVHALKLDDYPLLQGDSWGAGSLWGAYEWVAQKGKAYARVQELAKEGPSEAVREQAQLMLDLLSGSRESLTKNPSFEEGQGAAATHWGWWVASKGSMRRTDEIAHTGRYSGVCESFARGGPVQILDITPGKYALVCFVYIPPGQQSKGTAELSMTLRNAASENLMPSPSVKITPSPGRWTPLAIAANVPAVHANQEVKKMLPIIILDGFAEGEKVYFDDLMLWKME